MSSTNRVRANELLSVSDVAWLLGSEARVWRAIRTGALPHVLRRGRMMVPASAVRRLLTGPTGTDEQAGGQR
jgi:hypothetical protein